MTTSETAVDALVGDHLEFALRALGGEGSAAVRMEMAREHVRDALRGIRKIKDMDSGFGEVLEGVEPTQAGVEPRPAHNEEAA